MKVVFSGEDVGDHGDASVVADGGVVVLQDEDEVRALWYVPAAG